jgi:hypothetical protein
VPDAKNSCWTYPFCARSRGNAVNGSIAWPTVTGPENVATAWKMPTPTGLAGPAVGVRVEPHEESATAPKTAPNSRTLVTNRRDRRCVTTQPPRGLQVPTVQTTSSARCSPTGISVATIGPIPASSPQLRLARGRLQQTCGGRQRVVPGKGDEHPRACVSTLNTDGGADPRATAVRISGKHPQPVHQFRVRRKRRDGFHRSSRQASPLLHTQRYIHKTESPVSSSRGTTISAGTFRRCLQVQRKHCFDQHSAALAFSDGMFARDTAFCQTPPPAATDNTTAIVNISTLLGGSDSRIP